MHHNVEDGLRAVPRPAMALGIGYVIDLITNFHGFYRSATILTNSFEKLIIKTIVKELEMLFKLIIFMIFFLSSNLFAANVSDDNPSLTKRQRILREILLNIPIERTNNNEVLAYPYKHRSLEDMLAQFPKVKDKKDPEPKSIRTLDLPGLEKDFYKSLLDSSNDNIIAVALGSDVCLYNPVSKEISKLRSSDAKTVSAVHFFGNGEYLAVGTVGGYLHIWDVDKKIKLRKIKIAEAFDDDIINSMTSILNYPIIYVGLSKGNIIKYDLSKKVARINSLKVDGQKPHCGAVCSLMADRQGKFLVSGGDDNALKVWDLKAKEQLYFESGKHKASIKAIAWHDSGQYFATGSGIECQKIILWDIEKKEPVAIADTGSQITSLKWKGDRLFSTHGKNVNIFEFNTWQVNFDDETTITIKKEHTLIEHTDRIVASCFLGKDKSVIVTIAEDESMKFWRLSSHDSIHDTIESRLLKTKIR
jgi:cell division cycle protein 20 (cofactor of APC complex)